MQSLRIRAAFEFKCPESELSMRHLDEGRTTYGVSGCGQRAVYLYHCTGDGLAAECKWVINSKVE